MRTIVFALLLAAAPISPALADGEGWRPPPRIRHAAPRPVRMQRSRPIIRREHPRRGHRPVDLRAMPRCDAIAYELRRFEWHLRYDGRLGPDELRIANALRADYDAICGGPIWRELPRRRWW